ncbi:MAG: LacI family DNA-binding transcriptional regulator [Hyphomicrobiales bacterium]
MRPTLDDIAQSAKVSPATVDRVINDRPGASARTRAQVLAVARQLGYLPDAQDTPVQQIRVQLLLPHGTNAYIADLSRQAQEQSKRLPHIALDIQRTRVLDPLALASALNRAAETADAVAVVAMNHPAIREAIRALAAADIPVVTLASDIADAPRRAYIGINNGQAGRLAGYTLARFSGTTRTGKVALFSGSIGYRGHQEREMGFRQVLAEDFPKLELLELRKSREDRNKAYTQTRALLDAHSDLAGIYNAGGGTVGIAAALEDLGRENDIVFIAHEATEENKAYLLSGTLDAVINQNARAQIAETFLALSHAMEGQDYTPAPLHLQLILRENLPVI